jgi:hypothetical protein
LFEELFGGMFGNDFDLFLIPFFASKFAAVEFLVFLRKFELDEFELLEVFIESFGDHDKQVTLGNSTHW